MTISSVMNQYQKTHGNDNRQDYDNDNKRIDVVYDLEYCTNACGLTIDDIGTIHGDKLLNQHSIIERFDNLNCAMIMFHKLSHREDVVIAKLFQRITDNGESIIEDMIPDALLCSSRIETRMNERLQENVSFLEQELSIMREFLKKYNAERTYADYRKMALTDIERA